MSCDTYNQMTNITDQAFEMWDEWEQEVREYMTHCLIQCYNALEGTEYAEHAEREVQRHQRMFTLALYKLGILDDTQYYDPKKDPYTKYIR